MARPGKLTGPAQEIGGVRDPVVTCFTARKNDLEGGDKGQQEEEGQRGIGKKTRHGEREGAIVFCHEITDVVCRRAIV